jgi:hypothetical protein
VQVLHFFRRNNAVVHAALDDTLEECRRLWHNICPGLRPIQSDFLTPLVQSLLSMRRIRAVGDQEQKIGAKSLQQAPGAVWTIEKAHTHSFIAVLTEVEPGRRG